MPSIPWHRRSPGPDDTSGRASPKIEIVEEDKNNDSSTQSVSPSPPLQAQQPTSSGKSEMRTSSKSNEPSLTTPSIPHTPSPSSTSSKVLGKLRVQVCGAHSLTGKDRNGLSDPFFVINLPGAPPISRDRHHYRRTTPVRQKTLNPEWKDGEATFDWEITSEWLAALGPIEVENDGVIATDQLITTNDDDSQTISKQSSSTSMLSVPQTETITPSTRPSNVRKISAATGRLLIAPVRISAKGAMATTRVVRRQGGNIRRVGRPRPIRLRRGNQIQQQGGRAPVGSAALGDTNGTNGQQHHAVSAIEFVCWDKDKWSGNDYMGECSLLINDWIQEGKLADFEQSESISIPLVSTRRNAKVSGEVVVKIGFITSPDSHQFGSADELYERLLEAISKTGALGIRSIPADQSVGTTGPSEAFVDDGLSSDSEDEETQEELLSDAESISSDDEGDTATTETDDPYETDQSIAQQQKLSNIRRDHGHHHHHHQHRHSDRKEGSSGSGHTSDVHEKNKAEEESAPLHTDSEAITTSTPETQKTRRKFFPHSLRKSRSYLHSEAASGTVTPSSGATSDVEVQDLAHPAPHRKRRIGVRRKRNRVQTGGTESESVPADPTTKVGRKERRQKRREERQRRQDFAFKAEQGLDIIGIVQLEVKGAKDLPRWKNSLGTSFDMDAFVIVSFGQRIFRTRVVRHSLNPTWDEKLLFHVRRHEANYVTKLVIYDWDKLSSNDYVGEAEVHIVDLVEQAPKPDSETGLYAHDQSTKQEMKTIELPLTRHEDGHTKHFGNHSPMLTVQARFTPYAALRQRFWRQLLHQFDSNDSNSISILELMVMLDTLGSTLSPQTIEGWFSRFNKNGEDGDELTIDEAIIALEAEIVKPFSQKRVVDNASAIGGLDSINSTSTDVQTPSLESSMQGEILTLASSNDYSGPKAPTVNEPELASQGALTSEATVDAITPKRGAFARSIAHDESKLSVLSSTSSNTSSSTQANSRYRQNSTDQTPGESSSKDDLPLDEGQVERVIKLKSCPMCRMPRLSKKAEVDIVTHLAVCASQDWRRVDSMMVGNYVTAMQAHRKWVTKVISKISQGQYQLGANSANIIVQNRMTGEMLEEKMQVYVRLGIRLLYKGARSRMEGARIKRMLKNMSVKQGIKFDSPASAREIPHFIAFHSLNMDEVRDPLDSFKTFNEFFYRKLKPDARPIADADDPNTLVSTADCRFMAFSSVDSAKQIWIKGREFTVERLLGNGFLGKIPEDLEKYKNGGGVTIFRLAPQDYHRFHCPADAVVGKITMIEGQYYTVNPMAIRSAIDVYGENVRAIVPFHSEEFGTFYCVCIGAMMVGSILLSVKEGDQVKRGQEMGYFAFGGSTLVIVFEQGIVEFDEDLLANSEKAIETLVRVGMRIGRKAGLKGESIQTATSEEEEEHQ